MIRDLSLFSVRDASRSFLVSLRASNRYPESYLEVMERSLAFLSGYAEDKDWLEISLLTTSHLETYLADFGSRTKWFGERRGYGKLSQSYIEAQYRRIKTFFTWLKVRGHIEGNPLDPIPRPRIDERVVPTLSDKDMATLLALVDPRRFHTPVRRFRALHVGDAFALVIQAKAGMKMI
jgi:site-specific recombinase XerD